MNLASAPPQRARTEQVRNPGRELTGQSRLATGIRQKDDHQVDDLASDGLVVGGRERPDERGGEEVGGVGGEEAPEEGRVREGTGELGEGVGDVDGGGGRGGGEEEVGEAEQADAAALPGSEVQRRPVASRAGARRRPP